jgi:hypothetical protein
MLAVVQVEDDSETHVWYIRRPFHLEPDFGVTSVNYDLKDLLARAEQPT